MATCKKCGKQIPSGMDKCSYCGKKNKENIIKGSAILVAMAGIAITIKKNAPKIAKAAKVVTEVVAKVAPK